MRIFKSAYRHGIKPDDIERAWNHHLWRIEEDSDPVKVVRLGFDTHTRLLEVVGVWDETEWIIIHAMRARPKYLNQIDRS